MTHTELIARYTTVDYQLLSQEVINYEEGIYTNKIAVSSIGNVHGVYDVGFRNAVSLKYSRLDMEGNVYSYRHCGVSLHEPG